MAVQGETGGKKEAKCTCWVVMRGDTPHTEEWDTADCELVPDPSCPVHGKKRHPMLEDDDALPGGGSP